MLIIKALGIVMMGLLVISVVLGLISIIFAPRRTIWKALGLWGLGLAAGMTAMGLSLLSMRLESQHWAAMRAAGQHVPFNDMPGFGLVLLGWVGYIYFAAIFLGIMVIFGASFAVAKKAPPMPPDA